MLKAKWLKWKKRLISYCLAYGGKYLIKMLLSTCKISIQGLECFLASAKQEKCIIFLWHNRLALIAEILSRYAPQFLYAAVVSKSQDGDSITILANSYSTARTIRVPHNARHLALKKIVDSLKTSKEIILMTPDGPRGPLYKVKPGVVWIAQEANATLIPFSWTSNYHWELNTWDRFRIPKPFSKIQIDFGKPFKLETSNLDICTKDIQDILKTDIS